MLVSRLSGHIHQLSVGRAGDCHVPRKATFLAVVFLSELHQSDTSPRDDGTCVWSAGGTCRSSEVE